MRYAMKRADYEDLVILGPEDRKAGARHREEVLANEYPKSTPQAVAELRARGLNADPAMLDYLIRKGTIPEPKGGEGRNRGWTRQDIDRAAAHFDAEQEYVPGTVAKMFYNIDPAQDLRAQQKAFAENPHLPPDPSYFVMEIFPGAPGVGLYAEVRYRAMTPKEESEWKSRIEKAKRAQGKR